MGLLQSKFTSIVPIEINWEIHEDDIKKAAFHTNDGILTSPSVQVFKGIECHLKLFLKREGVIRQKITIEAALMISEQMEYKIRAYGALFIHSANFIHRYDPQIIKTSGDKQMLMDNVDFFNPSLDYIVNKKLAINFCGTFEIEKLENAPTHQPMPDLWESGHKDFTIIAEEKEIKVHKCVLETKSPYFKALFETRWKESTENKVEYNEYSFNVVNHAIKFCYGFEEISCKFPETIELLEFADRCQIDGLKEKIENELISNISVSNVSQLVNCSLNANAMSLREHCSKFLIACIQHSEPVADMDIVDTDFIKELFQNSFYPQSPWSASYYLIREELYNASPFVAKRHQRDAQKKCFWFILTLIFLLMASISSILSFSIFHKDETFVFNFSKNFHHIFCNDFCKANFKSSEIDKDLCKTKFQNSNIEEENEISSSFFESINNYLIEGVTRIITIFLQFV